MRLLSQLVQQVMILLERPRHSLDTKFLEFLGLLFAANNDGDGKSIACRVRKKLGKNSAANVSCENVSDPCAVHAIGRRRTYRSLRGAGCEPAGETC